MLGPPMPATCGAEPEAPSSMMIYSVLDPSRDFPTSSPAESRTGCYFPFAVQRSIDNSGHCFGASGQVALRLQHSPQPAHGFCANAEYRAPCQPQSPDGPLHGHPAELDLATVLRLEWFTRSQSVSELMRLPRISALSLWLSSCKCSVSPVTEADLRVGDRIVVPTSSQASVHPIRGRHSLSITAFKNALRGDRQWRLATMGAIRKKSHCRPVSGFSLPSACVALRAHACGDSINQQTPTQGKTSIVEGTALVSRFGRSDRNLKTTNSLLPLEAGDFAGWR
ncbi:hypothetical protein J3F83DRAFT_741366 [Trichoderma novae-zelandiae]